MAKVKVKDRYLPWLISIVDDERYSSYNDLFEYLYDKEFKVYVENDYNRQEDGIDLRYRFAYSEGLSPDFIERYFPKKCSILELMIALAIRCEEDIMANANYGDRTYQWFWSMIDSLGLSSMCDGRFDFHKAEQIIDIFLKREYEPNGKGGLFTVDNPPKDMRETEIWYQMCWYLDTILEEHK